MKLSFTWHCYAMTQLHTWNTQTGTGKGWDISTSVSFNISIIQYNNNKKQIFQRKMSYGIWLIPYTAHYLLFTTCCSVLDAQFLNKGAAKSMFFVSFSVRMLFVHFFFELKCFFLLYGWLILLLLLFSCCSDMFSCSDFVVRKSFSQFNIEHWISRIHYPYIIKYKHFHFHFHSLEAKNRNERLKKKKEKMISWKRKFYQSSARSQ